MLGVTETYVINLLVPTPQNGQTHSNISTAFCRRIVECCRPFCRFQIELSRSQRFFLLNFSKHDFD